MKKTLAVLGLMVAGAALLLQIAAVSPSGQLAKWSGLATNLVVLQSGNGTNLTLRGGYTTNQIFDRPISTNMSVVGALDADYVNVDNILELRVLALNSEANLTNTDLTLAEASRMSGNPHSVVSYGTNTPVSFSANISQSLVATGAIGFYFTNAPSGNYTEASIEMLVSASGSAREVWFPSPWVCYSTNSGAAVSIADGKTAMIAFSYKGTNVHYAIALQTN